MNDERPILVIHGVSNHDKDVFERRVGELNRRVSDGATWGWRFIPVFWGDLGAMEEGIEDTIPAPPLLSLLHVRDNREEPDMLSPVALETLNALFVPGSDGQERARTAAPGYQPVRSDEARRDTMADAARTRTAERVTVRADDTAEEVAEAIRASWADVVYLKAIDHPGVLEAVGRAVADAVTEDDAPALFDGDDAVGKSGMFAVRGDESDLGGHEVGTRRPMTAFRRFVGRVVYGVDRAVGAVLGEVLGSVQQFLRKKVSRGVARFMGDVLVYQRNQERIQQRLRSYLPAGWGTDDDHAVDVIAHSLGGVIVFDAATTAAPLLHVRRFVTFGSQAAFFQVIDPRTGLATYAPKKDDGTAAQAIPLPPTIGTWVSLWEPLDPLAFLAGSVFTLSSQQPPADKMVPHAPTQLWTHSEYWTSDFVVEAIRHVLSSLGHALPPTSVASIRHRDGCRSTVQGQVISIQVDPLDAN
jgi:hypothetical protein